ncbi:MAG: hypothetical protein WCO16_03615 [bacterium]
MKTTMPHNFVTISRFERTMMSIHHRFLEVVKRLDFLEKERIAQGLQIKRVDDNSRERFDIYMEHVNENFKAMMEHPVFSNYRA